MMSIFEVDGDRLRVRHHHEVLQIEPWGIDSVRVRAAQQSIPDADAGALEQPPPAGPAVLTIGEDQADLVNGELTVEVRLPATNGFPVPQLRFVRTSTGAELLAEEREHFWWPGPRA